MKKMIGKVATCQHGKTGIILNITNAKQEDNFKPISKVKEKKYLGIGFDGKPWESLNPAIIAENVNEYIATIRKPIRTVIMVNKKNRKK